MAVHTFHPNSHEHGLADDCPRCDEHASHPFETLDDTNLRLLIERTRAWMRDEDDTFARSLNERKAMAVIEAALVYKRMVDRLDEKAIA